LLGLKAWQITEKNTLHSYYKGEATFQKLEIVKDFLSSQSTAKFGPGYEWLNPHIWSYFAYTVNPHFNKHRKD